MMCVDFTEERGGVTPVGRADSGGTGDAAGDSAGLEKYAVVRAGVVVAKGVTIGVYIVGVNDVGGAKVFKEIK